MKLGIQIVLWIASIFFAYKIYDSINGPIKFNQVKNERYAKVIDRLKDIRKAQIAHKDVKGVFSNNFDSLVKFIDEGVFTLIEKRDSSYMEYDRTYRIDMLREVVVIDTLGTVAVKDSLFKNTTRYKNMAYIPIEGVQDSTFRIAAQVINKKLMPLHDALFCETSPGPLKYAASLMGICSSEARLPIVDIEDSSKENVKIALKKADLI